MNTPHTPGQMPHGFTLAAALKADSLDCQREDRAELLASAAREIEALVMETRQLTYQRNAHREALAACTDVMQRAFPNGLPIAQGTLCEEQDWGTSLRLAIAALTVCK